MPTPKQLINERNQCLEHWRAIDLRKLEKNVKKIIECLKSVSEKKITGHYVRQLHNTLGYKAAGSLRNGGLCKGCLYRSEAFIRLPQERRTGNKNHPPNVTKVHVEHTIPIAVLSNLIGIFDETKLQPEQVLHFLLENSITTAMLESEGRTPQNPDDIFGLVLKGYSRTCGVYIPDHNHSGRPFMRYTAQAKMPRIFNVLTGEEINARTFTMEDFRKDLHFLLSRSGLFVGKGEMLN